MNKFMTFLASLILCSSLTGSVSAQPFKLGVAMQQNFGGGVRIVDVIPGSPAEAVGLQAGMLMLSINGMPTNTPWAARDIIEADTTNHLSILVRLGGWLYRYEADLAPVVVYGARAGAAPLRGAAPTRSFAPTTAAPKTLKNIKVTRVGPAPR
jgi:membrane-associated protease RseP (regulator of RpoE activity)